MQIAGVLVKKRKKEEKLFAGHFFSFFFLTVGLSDSSMSRCYQSNIIVNTFGIILGINISKKYLP